MLRQSPPRLKSIDGLRGLAALAVMLCHARALLWIGLVATWEQYGLSFDPWVWLGYATAPLYFGSLGVTLFFVLSGYCIHRRAAHQRQNEADGHVEMSWRAFATRRLWRIYPTYIAALIITLLAELYMQWHTPAQRPADHNELGVTFVASLFSLNGIVAPNFHANGAMWTLALELHLYAVYPVLYYISRAYGAKKTLLFSFVVSMAYVVLARLLHLNEWLPYRGAGGPIFLPYWFTWTIGFFIAEVEAGAVQRPRISRILFVVCGLLAIALYVLKFRDVAEFGFAIVFGGLLFWSLDETGARFWDHPLTAPFATIGLFSYSLYAIHEPVLFLFRTQSAGEISVSLLPTIEGVFLSLVGAWILFQTVERWSLRQPKPALIASRTGGNPSAPTAASIRTAENGEST